MVTASGLGRTIAYEAGRLGANGAMVSRSTTLMEEVGGEIEKMGRKALIIQADITSQDACNAAAEKTQATFGRIDGPSIRPTAPAISPR